MPSDSVTLTNAVGLHARPAAQFVRRAAEFDATITVHKQQRQADAKSLLALLKLDVRSGDQVTISTGGPDADAALTALVGLVHGL